MTTAIIVLSGAVAFLIFLCISMGYYIRHIDIALKKANVEKQVWFDVAKRKEIELEKYRRDEINV